MWMFTVGIKLIEVSINCDEVSINRHFNQAALSSQ
jgi:hypothetical protein